MADICETESPLQSVSLKAVWVSPPEPSHMIASLGVSPWMNLVRFLLHSPPEWSLVVSNIEEPTNKVT